MWRFERKPWTFVSGSEKTGVFRSLDAGRTWKQLTTGLPKGWGRIGVRVAPINSNVVYVIGESNEGTLYRCDDRGDHFHMMTKNPVVVGRGLYYSHLTIDPTDENRIYSIGMRLSMSIDGGRTIRPASPNDSRRLITPSGSTRRIPVAYMDRRGRRNRRVLRPRRNVGMGRQHSHRPVLSGVRRQSRAVLLPLRRPAGQRHLDRSQPQQSGRASSTATGRNVSGGDGFHVVNHLDQPWLFLSESQGGGIVRTDLRTREQQDVSPQPRRNDGGPVGELKYRFNWNAPIVLSPHDNNTVYFGSNVVFKSTDFGKTWTAISPDLTTNDPEKQKSVGTVWTENTTAEYHCTIIRIAESPVQAGVIWAGTDDGNLQVTRDGGKSWTNVTGNAPGVPKFAEIAWMEPSPHRRRHRLRGLRTPLVRRFPSVHLQDHRLRQDLHQHREQPARRTITSGW